MVVRASGRGFPEDFHSVSAGSLFPLAVREQREVLHSWVPTEQRQHWGNRKLCHPRDGKENGQ